ncbi:hypothetical protein NPX13_g10349 [Xylaria arbuscula]|uniref:Uncharacterized protein n=1 Tax=Xylaria arbuscula TaxID=114810 RepID=A0A9W8N586_9PEZI|nr:hypothetical protein NPX13_g10349 [Xylaria arbuscula]
MCQHWSEVHGEPNSKAIRYREARLQTFFRGNKIRYFEVEGPKHLQCWTTQKESQLATQKTGASLPADLERGSPDENPAPPLDHRSLLYMHHYTRHSALFLNRGSESTEFWADTMVLEAQKHPFLMYSLLCISAIDKARKSADTVERREHLEASASYCAGAISGYRVAVAGPTRENSTAILACSRLLGQQEAVRDLIRFEETRDHRFTVEDIIEHLVLLKGCTDLMIQLQSTLPPDSPFRLPDKVRLGLKDIEEHDTTATHISPGCIPTDTWLTLDSLEAKLLAARLLPPSEAPMIRRAIQLLAYATTHAYGASEDDVGWAGWNAVEGWLRSPVVADELLPAMRELRPAALVVFISWAMMLLRRIEEAYDWMTGLSVWFVRVTIEVAQNTEMEMVVRQMYKFE